MNLSINNFEKLCRACLIEKANMRSIFDAFVADMLMSCANIQIVKSDDLPKSICIQCLQQVNRSYSFKQLCEKSDNLLRQCLRETRNQTEEKQAKEMCKLDKHRVDKKVLENKDSVEYRIKTEQLKLEISEHLKLDVKQQTDCDGLESWQDEGSEDAVENDINSVDAECGDNFQCNECNKTFKGRS